VGRNHVQNPLEKKSLIHGETGADAEDAKGAGKGLADKAKDAVEGVKEKLQGK